MHSVLQRFYTYTSLGVALRGLALATPVVVLAPATVLLAYAVVLRVHTSESLLVLRGLGVQTSCSPPTYLGGSSGATRFIPTEKIRDILVNEAFRGFEVRYYLVVIVEDEPDVVVVFPRLLPPRAIVETVWRAARECLYEPAKG
ncbi:phosphatidylinositol N-acetylglucosaminyltransferase subunit H [Geosmithia morbida]|uniref:Phosphatidylinositol N-acetylglucosaminyltransferase subunit H n=1 Tax=Geosmithia morbida TaxID=1094350 RepID=A0A9P4Z231_9HYPO|nr:phosphatidylinositol N-acetylglucosaminyltransferase subunit H [Geosmithia morbida]KAF4125848.1 phosphatidylinositol N-acetylglucosaminyltransferase subunit H [Geosmithia morbida]